MTTKWKRKVDNKMRNYGETDFSKKQIRINKKRAKKKPLYKRPVNKHAKKYPDVLGTIVHEEMHKNRPNMHEKTVWRKERQQVQKLSHKQKQSFYRKYT